MKLYADTPGRRTTQILSDVLVVAWVVVCVVLGRIIHDAVLKMLAPAQQIQNAGSTFGGAMRQARQAVAGVPLIGEQLARPFDQAAGAGSSVNDAGRRLAEAVSQLASLLGLLTTLLPALLVVGAWLVVRLRFARRAGAAQRFIDADADLDLFALRAIARQPMQKLAAISPDPAGAWRRGDAQVVRELALLELRDSGLRPPQVARTSADPPRRT